MSLTKLLKAAEGISLGSCLFAPPYVLYAYEYQPSLLKVPPAYFTTLFGVGVFLLTILHIVTLWEMSEVKKQRKCKVCKEAMSE